MQHLMPMTEIAWDWCGSGSLCPKAIFCTEVSAVVFCVAVTFVDLMSSHPLSCLYDKSIDVAFDADEGSSLGLA